MPRKPKEAATAPKGKKAKKAAAKKAKAPAKHPGGRPTDYRPEYAKQAQKLVENGFTDWELAEFFNVSRRTIYRWQASHGEFCHALKTGRGPLDDRVERSLYHKATGYTFKSEKVFQFQGQIVRAETIEHVPPDTAAMIFWLKNRRKEDWRDKHELTGENGASLLQPIINVTIPSGPEPRSAS